MVLNFRTIIKVFGILSLIEGLFMLPCAAVGLYHKEYSSVNSFFIISSICIILGLAGLARFRYDKITLRTRDGYFIAFISWVYCSFLGAVPLYFCGKDFSFINCLFESVAGFSTTGATVLETGAVPLCLLMWRALCHWLGGMGILVFLVSLFPLYGANNQALAMAETPAADSRKIEAKYSDMGKFLYLTYLALSAAEFTLLVIGPMDWYEAILTTCSSISTAGLIIRPDSAWLYDTQYVRVIVAVFTILSSLNFMVYFLLLKRRWKEILSNTEIRIFFAVIAAATALIALSLKAGGIYGSLFEAAENGFFQVVSFISTSGYFVCDYTDWPAFATAILILLLFIGGCSFSTSGSLKVIRVLVFFKLIKRGLLQQIHPHMVKAVMLNDRVPVSAKTASSITTHTLLFFIIFMIGCILLSFDNFDMETTITTSIGMFSNTGLSLGVSGSSGYFGMFSEFSQLTMCFLMIAGRLEMYALVIIFAKSFWKPDKAVNI